MLNASELRVGQVLRIQNGLWKVLSQEVRGTGKFGKTVHAKLKNLEDGNSAEKSFRYEEKLEDVEVHRVKLQFLYEDGDRLIFMNSEDYTQPGIPAKALGKQRIFLKENSEIETLMVDERILSIEFPAVSELKVISAPEPMKAENTGKEIELENGLKVIAPQFIKAGDDVRIDTETFAYLDRVTSKSMKYNKGIVVQPKEDKPEKDKKP